MGLRSKCWQLFDKKSDGNEVFAICKKCPTRYHYKGSTTILTYHIKKHHSGDLNGENETSSSPGIQKFLSKSVPSSIKKKLDDELALFFATSYSSLRAVENIHLKNMTELLGYSLPSRRTLMKSVEEKAKEISAKTKERLENATNLCFTTDGWTSRNATTCMQAITAHFYEPHSWVRQNIVLSVADLSGSHTGQKLADTLLNAIPSSCLSLTSYIVCDGASNVVKACELIKKQNVHCLAHKLNLCVQSALKLQPICGLLADIRNFIKKLKRSPRLREKLKEKCMSLNIPSTAPYSDCSVRWNSSFKMLKCFLEKKPAYDVLMFDEKCPVLDVYATSQLRKVVEILEIFEEATLQVSKSHESLGVFLSIHCLLKFSLNNFKRNSSFDECATFIEEIEKGVEKYFDDVKSNEVFKLAAFFDPRFAFLSSIMEETEWCLLQDVVREKFLTDGVAPAPVMIEKEKKLWNDFLFSRPEAAMNNNELSQYKMTLSTSRPSIESSIDTWWEAHALLFPRLASVAKTFLVVPASSVDSERLFSILGVYYGNRRRVKLSNKTTRSLVLISSDQKEIKEKSWIRSGLCVIDANDETCTDEIYDSDESSEASLEL